MRRAGFSLSSSEWKSEESLGNRESEPGCCVNLGLTLSCAAKLLSYVTWNPFNFANTSEKVMKGDGSAMWNLMWKYCISVRTIRYSRSI